MKKYITILILLLSVIVNAQNISPSVNNEFCPNQPYTFTISELAHKFTSIRAESSTTQISSTQVSTDVNGISTVTFQGVFGDFNLPQTITVTWEGGEKSFTFKKIKSFFYGYKKNSNNPTVLNIPFCMTSPMAVTISGDQYVCSETNGNTAFGSISNYKFLLPQGWYLNSTLSTGSNWIQGTNSFTITPTANTGDMQDILYKPMNDCSANRTLFGEGNVNYIQIKRTNPSFSLNPLSTKIDCGTTPTITFTVSSSSTAYCSLSYIWNLGSNNGWLYNGSSAPNTLTTTTNSLSLQVANEHALPSSVSVTPVYNGMPQSELKCSVEYSPFIVDAEIDGLVNVCTNTPSSYNINAGGNSVNWNFSGANAFVDVPTDSTATISTGFSGKYLLTATITNPCGQKTTKTKKIWVGTPIAYISNNPNDCSALSAPCSLVATPNNGYMTFSLTADLGESPAISWQWEKLSGNFFFFDGISYQGVLVSGQIANIYLNGKNPTNAPLYFRVRVKNTCGWGDWRTYTWNDGTTDVIKPKPDVYFKLYPNPASNGFAISLIDNNIAPNTNGTITAKLYNNTGGQLLQTIQLVNNSGSFYIGPYAVGNYTVVISFENHTESLQLIKK